MASLVVGVWMDGESAVIEQFHYCVESRKLDVTFASSGETYRYADVPTQVAIDMMDAAMDAYQSVGAYFARMVRDHYSHTKLP